MDRVSVERHIKLGAIAASVYAATVAAEVLNSIGRDGVFSLFDDPWNALEVAFILVCCYGVLRRSRTAAVCLTLNHGLGRVFVYSEPGHDPGIVGLAVAILFLYVFLRAVQATFAYHRRRRQAEPDYRPAPRWTYFLLIPGGLVLGLIVVLAVWAALGPPVTVVSGKDLDMRTVRLLRDNGVLQENEQVALFYSAGLFSVLEEGCLLTDERVVSYAIDGEELEISAAAFDEISGISVKGGDWSDTLVTIDTVIGEPLVVAVSPTDGGDERFLQKLRGSAPQIGE